MTCESFQEDFLAYRANRLDPQRARAIGDHLRTCLDCQRAWADFQQLDQALHQLPLPAPSEALSRNFYAMLDTHLGAQRTPGVFAPLRHRFHRWWAEWMPAHPVAQVASLALLLGCGTLTALWLHTRRERDADLAALGRQIDAVTRLVAYTALERQPASDRVQTLLAANTHNAAGLARLLSALALDPNINVRLSALEALYPAAAQPEVLAGVLSALSRETSPILQVAMIDFLVAANASEAQRQFERLSRDPAANSTVRAAASRGLVQLL